MDLSNLAMAILPIILFVVVEIRYGMKAGILTSIVAVIGVGIWFYLKTGRFDQLLAIEAALLVGLGMISLRLKNSRYFKLQPFIVGMIFSIYMAYLHFFSEPLLIHYLPLMLELNPELSSQMGATLPLDKLRKMSNYLFWLIFLHSFLVLWTAFQYSSTVWLLARLSVYPGLAIVVILSFL